MTTEFVQNDEYDEMNTAIVPVNTHAAPESVTAYDAPATESEETIESTAEVWRSIQATMTAVFANATVYIGEFFKNNRRSLTTLGWIVLAFLAARFLFAVVDAIDDIPLVTPLLELIGFVYVVRFVWRYLLRQNDRQEFMQTLDRVKAEVFGNQS